MKANWHILAILLSAGLFGCVSSTKREELENTIVPAHRAEFTARAMGQDGVVFWTPSKADVASALARIPAFLATEAPALGRHLGRYRRQFIGVLIDGQKRLYCNFLPLDTANADGHSQPVVEKDNEAAPFQVEYDIESKHCLSLRLRGKR